MSFVSDRERNPLLGSDPLPGGIVPKKMTYLNLVIIFGGVLMASLGATSNSFNALQSNIQDSVGLSDSQMSIMAGAGLLGTNFMIPAGIMRDNLGLFKTGMISILLSGGGYLGMAYCTVPGLYVPMLICFFMAGFGGGACFLCALNTAIQISPSGGGWGVAATSAVMSFSISLTVYIINWTTSIFDCDVATDSSCAFLYLKAIGISCLGVQFIGLLFTLFFNRKNYLHLLTLEDDDTEVVKSIKSLGTDLTHISQPGRSITGRQLTTSSLAAYAVHGRSATTLLSGPTDAEGRPTGARPKYELLNKINNGDDDAATALAVETKSFVDTLQILKHPLFLKLGFGYYLGFASAFFIISQAQQIWQMYGYEDQAKYSLILPVFSYSTIVANVVTSLASDYLNTHKILSHAQYMGVVHLIFAVDFLLIWVFSAFIETKSIAVLFMMGLNGLSFGSVVTCYPTSLGFIYGLNNFSKPFAFLGIGSGLAAFTTPILGNALIKALGPENFAYSYLGMGVLLLVAAILTLTSKTKPYKWR